MSPDVLVHHELSGPPDAPVLVLANSLGTDTRLWDLQVGPLSERFRVLRYDHRGHGRSPVPAGPYGLADLSRDLLRLLDRLEIERASLCGVSLGGVDFYADVLGLRLVKTTVNFDQPEAYHLYFGDEAGSPGSILTWFEFRGAAPGRAGLGMVHRIALAVPGEAALDFWQQRLTQQGVAVEREDGGLRFADRDGLGLELVVHDIGAQLRAAHPDVPAEHAITGVAGARAYGAFHAVPDGVLTDLLGFDHEGDGHYVLRGEQRHVHWTIDPAPDAHGQPGAGTVHHIAWAARDEDHAGWRQRIADGGGFVTPIIDRDYFFALYFREPHGVLFEIATLGPGFATDEQPEHLGEELRLPTQHEHLRSQLDGQLTRIVNPRSGKEVRA